MGCDEAVDDRCRYYEYAAEVPLHPVYLDAYYIDKYEVTNDRYQNCVNAGACTVPVDELGNPDPRLSDPAYKDHPVISVSWDQASQFCKWDSKRLATEAEWERAARGDLDTRMYPWGNTFYYTATNTSTTDTTMVGSYPSDVSPYGILDMAGNAAEWTDDWFYSGYYAVSPPSNPMGPDTSYPFCSYARSVRGGSFSTGFGASYARLTYRSPYAIPGMGIRCVKPTVPNMPTPVPTATPVACGQLGGVLQQDTTLQAGCTYEVGSNVLVPENITLTILPGTMLRFGSEVYLKVDGKLIAEGSESKPIKFTSMAECSKWGGVYITSQSRDGSVLRHVVIEKATGVPLMLRGAALQVGGAQPTLSDIVFRYNVWPLNLYAGDGFTATIENSVFMSNTREVSLASGFNIVRNSVFTGNSGNASYPIIEACEGAQLIGNRIHNNTRRAINIADCSSSAPVQIISNTIESNGASAIASVYETGRVEANIQYNIIRNNGSAFALADACLTSIHHNNITENRGEFDIRAPKTNCTVDASGNWWGTANRDEIAARILDYYDDFEYGKVGFEPYATEPYTDVGAP